jgi:hypothetical protein
MLRLTKEARHAFTCAQAEARRMGDSRVGTGHLLLGLLAAGELGPSDVDALRAIGRRRSGARAFERRGVSVTGSWAPSTCSSGSTTWRPARGLRSCVKRA